MSIRPLIASDDQLTAALNRYYPEEQSQSINDLLDEMGDDDDLAKFEGRGESLDLEELRELTDSNPVKQLLNLVLLQAIRDKASDIHFEPFEDEYKLRYRIDGVLYEMRPPPRFLAMAIASRLKVMADLDIAERRMDALLIGDLDRGFTDSAATQFKRYQKGVGMEKARALFYR